MERPEIIGNVVRGAGSIANGAVEVAPPTVLFGGGLLFLSGRPVEGFGVMVGSVAAERVRKLKRKLVERHKVSRGEQV